MYQCCTSWMNMLSETWLSWSKKLQLPPGQGLTPAPEVNSTSAQKVHINLNSPKQLAQLLFHDLKLPPQRKTKTGYSTDEEVLEVLAHLHPVPGLIIKWRELAKLKSTYIDALPTYVNPRDGRVHTTFSQTNVATGRLASFDPNLQNIPVHTKPYDVHVRTAFKPDKGHLFISADYSQIELRVLAFLSGDKALINAFNNNIDIHTQKPQPNCLTYH